jgi:uncharacterized protein (TIGR02186 family)
MRPARLLGAAVLVLLGLAGPAAAQQQLVVELAQPQIEIDLAFKGSELLIFGLTGETDADAVVVMRGTTGPETIRRKERIAGVWTTGQTRSFLTVPDFYALAASKPLDELFPEQTALGRFELAPENLNLAPLDIVPDDPDTDAFRKALIEEKLSSGLYSREVSPIKFLSAQLFRTKLYIPSNVPIGSYSIRLLTVKDGRVVAQKETTLVVNKVGLEEGIYRFAHNEGPLYGIFAVTLALASGWLITFLFRRTP